MKTVLTFFALLCFCFEIYAQPNFFKSYGSAGDEKAWGISKNSDGGFTVVGEVTSAASTNKDIYAARLDAHGDTLWTKRFGGLGEEIARSVVQTYDEGFLIAGYTNSLGAGGSDFYILKTDGNGTAVWGRTIGGALADEAHAVIQTVDSGFAILGQSSSFDSSGGIYLAKTDQFGNVQWTRLMGSPGFDIGYDLAETIDSGFILTGTTPGFGAGGYDAFAIKTDANGTMQWAKTFGGADEDFGYSVKPTADSGYILTGSTKSFGNGLSDLMVIKLNYTGNLQWAKSIGNTGIATMGWDIIQSADFNSFIITGTSSFDSIRKSLLLKISNTGALIWNKNFRASIETASQPFSSYFIETAGHYVLACRSNRYGAGNNDILITKVDGTGEGVCYDSTIVFNNIIPNIVTTNPSFSNSAGWFIGSFIAEAHTTTIVKDICLGVGIEDILAGADAIKIFPNPAENTLNIQIPSCYNHQFSVEIISEMGVPIQKSVRNRNIDISGLAPGFYIVKIHAGDVMSVQKLLKI